MLSFYFFKSQKLKLFFTRFTQYKILFFQPLFLLCSWLFENTSKKIILLYNYVTKMFFFTLIQATNYRYRVRLKIFGNGFFFRLLPSTLILYFGKSHLHNIVIPTFFQVILKGRKKRFLLITASNFFHLQNFCFTLQNFCKPDIYRGKGLRYVK